MIGPQKTGTLPGVVVTAVSHEGLSVTFDGRPARLAVVLDDGTIIAAGADVAREVEAVAVNSFCNMLQGKGYLRVIGNPLAPNIVPRSSD